MKKKRMSMIILLDVLNLDWDCKYLLVALYMLEKIAICDLISPVFCIYCIYTPTDRNRLIYK